MRLAESVDEDVCGDETTPSSLDFFDCCRRLGNGGTNLSVNISSLNFLFL